MTFTNDERREVAARLRKTHGIKAFVKSLGIDLNGDWYWTDVSRRVADLIDVPTTRNVATDKTQCHAPQDFMCEHCGYWAAVDPGFRYCPECDAEVVTADGEEG